MSDHRIGLSLAALATLSSMLAGSPPAACAQSRGIQLSLGAEQRSIQTHFYDYNGGNAQNTWETYPLLGAKAELGVRIWQRGNTTVQGGIGLGVFSVGAYDYEVRISKGQGPSGGFGYEVDLMAQGSIAAAPNLSLFGRAGASYLGVDVSGSSTLPAPYQEDFSAGFPDVFVAGGAQLDFTPKFFGAALVRANVADLGSWTDYGTSPVVSSVSSIGFRAMIGIKL
jgi:hypothetical protein